MICWYVPASNARLMHAPNKDNVGGFVFDVRESTGRCVLCLALARFDD